MKISLLLALLILTTASRPASVYELNDKTLILKREQAKVMAKKRIMYYIETHERKSFPMFFYKSLKQAKEIKDKLFCYIIGAEIIKVEVYD